MSETFLNEFLDGPNEAAPDNAIRDQIVDKLKTIYAEPAYPDTALHAIAEATGAKVLRLDDLGGPQREGYRTYFEMMESNLKVLVEGQR